MTSVEFFSWPNESKCAVSLTYDDALAIHYQKVAPALSEFELTATFNLPGSPGLTNAIDQWRKVAALGHELGNHTLFHPCRMDPGQSFSWLEPHYNLANYSKQRWVDEIRIANCLLNLIDGHTERTYGNTCCNTTIGPKDKEICLDELINEHFLAGRGPLNSQIVQPSTLNLAALGHFAGDRKTFIELEEVIEDAVESGGWVVLMFHGVGEGTHGSFIDTDEHDKLVEYLGANKSRIWSRSMAEVARHVRGLA